MAFDSKVSKHLLVLWLMLGAALAAPNSPSVENKTEIAEVSEIKWSFYNIAALTTAILIVSAGFSAVVSLFLPIFAYKLCYLLGGCNQTLDAYVDQFVANNLRSRRINRRSVDYLQPLVDALALAYDEYSDDDDELKKNFNTMKQMKQL